MAQIILHANEAFVEEDRAYYFSKERDKHDQVRPSEDVYSTTPVSGHLGHQLDDGRVGNFLFPFMPNQLERIYIGISISLFANRWGASFLLELLKSLRPGGCIVLPVYPEEQAAEKGYWSRSFLENIFLSRSRWRGMSNIYAENDGVMSLRVGRKWPEPIPGTAEWFFRERGNLVLRSVSNRDDSVVACDDIRKDFADLCRLVWNEYRNSAVIERIISDVCAAGRGLAVLNIGCDYGLLVSDLLLSRIVSVDSGVTCHLGPCDRVILDSVVGYFYPLNGQRHRVEVAGPESVRIDEPHDLICVDSVFDRLGRDRYRSLLQSAWASLRPSGVLVICETFAERDAAALKGLDQICARLGSTLCYSMLVAAGHSQDTVISHYSTGIEQELANEPVDKKKVYRVLVKPRI